MTFETAFGEVALTLVAATAVDHAADSLGLVDSGTPREPDDFGIATVRVSALKGWAGQTRAALEPSTRLGVSVLALAGENGSLSAPDARRLLSPDDVLVLGGPAEVTGD